MRALCTRHFPSLYDTEDDKCLLEIQYLHSFLLPYDIYLDNRSSLSCIFIVHLFSLDKSSLIIWSRILGGAFVFVFILMLL